jgi:nitrate/nitrite-specific signal transduction histidine kinase
MPHLTLDPATQTQVIRHLRILSSHLKEEDQRCMIISQMLHKEVSGSLVACSSIGEMIRHELSHSTDATSVGKLLTSLDANLRQAMQIVRELTERQFPPVLKVFGLNAALQQLVRSISEEFAGSLVLNINGDEPQFDLARRLNLFHLMEAILRHCVRHARTSWVEVTCRACPENLEITVDHDGEDDLWTAADGGADIPLIEARCLLLGSRLEVMRTATGGTRVGLLVFHPVSTPS